jgi:superfamily II DNA helicase RecQ
VPLSEPDIDSSILVVVAAPAAVFDSVAAASTEPLRAALVDYTLDCTADFRSDVQRQALGELVRRNTDNAIVLPTGSSKSFLYMLMACMPRPGVTVVILLFVALLHNVVARCRTEQVPYTMWADMNRSSTQPVMGVRVPLVFATVEQALQW